MKLDIVCVRMYTSTGAISSVVEIMLSTSHMVPFEWVVIQPTCTISIVERCAVDTADTRPMRVTFFAFLNEALSSGGTTVISILPIV